VSPNFADNFKLEMEKAKSLREMALGAISKMTNFWLLAEGPKCRDSHRGNLLYPRKCSISFEKYLRGTIPSIFLEGN
jgi:hypothetical protein